MNDIPDFAEAVERFRRFLSANGHPTEVLWVFRNDIWQRSPADMRIKYLRFSDNVTLAEKVFAEGRERRLVEIKALGAAKERVVATVWFPKYRHEEVQGWNRGMKLVIADPLPCAKLLRALPWWLLGFLPRFRHYQSEAVFIGTKAWALSDASLG